MDSSPENFCSMDDRLYDRLYEVFEGEFTGAPYDIAKIILDNLAEQCKDPAQRDTIIKRLGI